MSLVKGFENSEFKCSLSLAGAVPLHAALFGWEPEGRAGGVSWGGHLRGELEDALRLRGVHLSCKLKDALRFREGRHLGGELEDAGVGAGDDGAPRVRRNELEGQRLAHLESPL